jgi:hypothetical protein
MKANDTQQIPTDTLLAEELAREEVVEMANLTTAQTGVPGTIFISTAIGGNGPRVKYFLQPGRSHPSFSVTISGNPTVVANSLPNRVVRQRSPQVINWVSINKDVLLDFWYRGDTWTQPEVNDFIQNLTGYESVRAGTDIHHHNARTVRERRGPKMSCGS